LDVIGLNFLMECFEACWVWLYPESQHYFWGFGLRGSGVHWGRHLKNNIKVYI